jgi:protein-tyrosine kinase
MSRIHEAFRRAGLQQGSAQPALDTGSVAKELANRNGGILAGTSERPLPLGAGVRFEDLLAQCAHPEWQPDPKLNLFLNPSQHAEATEQLRILRSRLYQVRKQQILKIILITSAVPGEGKSFLAANLAQAIVRQNPRRALLIDADLRFPHQHLILRGPLKPGMTDYLSGAADEMAVIQHGQEGNLCFVPAGETVPNPNELLATGRLKTLLDRVTSAFDWVIIDSPPCLPVADARVIGELCDGVLLVLRAGSTHFEVAQKAQQTFPEKKIVGVILNRIEKSLMTYASAYYPSK